MQDTALLFYNRPNPVLFVDDDSDFLDTLQLALPQHDTSFFYTDPHLAVAQLIADQPKLEAEYAQHHAMLATGSEGPSVIAQMLQLWQADNQQRHRCAGILVADYSMPAMNGLEMIRQLGAWPGARLLLTGQADDGLAVSAFNSGLIQQFIPKQNPCMVQDLQTFLHNPPYTVISRISLLWHDALTHEQQRALQPSSVAQALAKRISACGWTEHVVVSQPFGVLGKTQDGAVGWLQLECDTNEALAHDLTDMARSFNWQEKDLALLQSGHYTADFELRLALAHSMSMDSDTMLNVQIRPLEPLCPDCDIRVAGFVPMTIAY